MEYCFLAEQIAEPSTCICIRTNSILRSTRNRYLFNSPLSVLTKSRSKLLRPAPSRRTLASAFSLAHRHAHNYCADKRSRRITAKESRKIFAQNIAFMRTRFYRRVALRKRNLSDTVEIIRKRGNFSSTASSTFNAIIRAEIGAGSIFGV